MVGVLGSTVWRKAGTSSSQHAALRKLGEALRDLIRRNMKCRNQTV